MNFCPKCGSQISTAADDLFCANCGANIGAIREVYSQAAAVPTDDAEPISDFSQQYFTAPEPAVEPFVSPEADDPFAAFEESISPATVPDVEDNEPSGESFDAPSVEPSVEPSADIEEIASETASSADSDTEKPSDSISEGAELEELQGVELLGMIEEAQGQLDENVASFTLPQAGGFDVYAQSDSQPLASDFPQDIFAENAEQAPLADTANDQFLADASQSEPQDLFSAPASQAPVAQAAIIAAAIAPEQIAAPITEAAPVEPPKINIASPQKGKAKPTKPATPKSPTKPVPPAPPVQEAAPAQTPFVPIQESTPQETTIFNPASFSPHATARIPSPPVLNLPDDDEDFLPPRRSIGKRIITWFFVFILFIAVTLATVLVMLWFQNRPINAVEEFVSAVESSDVATLQSITELEEGLTPSQEEWLAFCAAFEDTTALNTLKSQLLIQAEETAPDALEYPAVDIISGDLFSIISFIKQYRVHISAVDLYAPQVAAGTVVRLNTTEHTGTADSAGELYVDLMPGKYTCLVIPPDVDAASVSPIEIEIFSVSEANILQDTQSQATLTIENCLSDDALFYVNDVATPFATPVNGVVEISNVPLGATIRIVVVQDGVTMESLVTFSDMSTTTLRFENYTQVDEITPPSASSEPVSSQPVVQITADEINTLLATFYPSYLECINQQSTDPLQLSTDANKLGVGERITLPDNAANTFTFASATVDADSIAEIDASGTVPSVRFNASFTYTYQPRDASTGQADGATQYTMQLVYQDGQWLMNNMTYVSPGDFDNNVLAG